MARPPELLSGKSGAAGGAELVDLPAELA